MTFFVFANEKELFPKKLEGGYNGDQFIRLVNKFLKPFSEKHNLILKSHSFRVNFVTSLLKKTEIQHAQQMTGHKDVRSTIASNRYSLSGQDRDKILNDAFNYIFFFYFFGFFFIFFLKK